MIGLLTALALASSAALPQSRALAGPERRAPPYAGVNLATGGFGSRQLPGVYGRHYIYPDQRTALPFLAAGMTSIRLPILWERIQRSSFAPLDEQEMQRIDRTIRELAGFRQIIIDVHNYARYHGVRLDEADPAGATLANLWSQLASRYRDRPEIAFGLMNEPHGLSARAWRTMADAAMVAIRETGARNLVLVPGTNWTATFKWTAGGEHSNAAAFAGFRDPAGNFAFEMHQYLDADSSGTGWQCVSEQVGVERLVSATEWLRANGFRGFLGEFGVSSAPLCLVALDHMLDYIDANSDVWMGWTYWAAGAWWGDYPMSVQPLNGRPRPQFEILERHLPAKR